MKTPFIAAAAAFLLGATACSSDREAGDTGPTTPEEYAREMASRQHEYEKAAVAGDHGLMERLSPGFVQFTEEVEQKCNADKNFAEAYHAAYDLAMDELLSRE